MATYPVISRKVIPVQLQAGITPIEIIDIISKTASAGTAVTSALQYTLPQLAQKNPDMVVSIEHKMGDKKFPPTPSNYVSLYTQSNLRVMWRPGAKGGEFIRSAIKSSLPGFIAGVLVTGFIFSIIGLRRR